MSDRKFKTAVNAVLNLIYNIQYAFNIKQVILYLFLNVKKAFNYVLKNQLLQNFHKFNLLKLLINWVDTFMIKK